MPRLLSLVGLVTVIFVSLNSQTNSSSLRELTGFAHPQDEKAIESRFLAVPDPQRAREHLRILTQAPHVAGTPEDKATADYVAQKFRDAGLETKIVEYKIWINYPKEISVDVTRPADVHMHGPTREHVDGDPYQDDPRVFTPFSGMSPSGDVEAEVVYVNYGTPADFQKLADMKVDLHGKIVIARYGQNYRGVKAELAHEYGAAGLILYSDPADDGRRRGPVYPNGPWRPDSGVQRGSINAIWQFPGDVTTPGVASVPNLPAIKRIKVENSAAMAKIPTTPISAADATPILEHLGGPTAGSDWKGGLPFDCHVGPGPVRVKLHLIEDFQFRTIWDVIGTVRGSPWPDALVVAGNHRDAWVYGAVDPNSGTAAMLEAVHGLGELLKQGWRPRRTILIGSWDAEEEGLMGSTEWAEQHASLLSHAVAYFNTDVGVSGPEFKAAAVPSLKQFVRDVTKQVQSPKGGTVYEQWKEAQKVDAERSINTVAGTAGGPSRFNAQVEDDVRVGDLGSGSDYTPFIQHLGVPSTDIGSEGPYGVYHSVFDNYNWFIKFADPTFVYEQQQARVFGLEILHMADVDVLPYDYNLYGREIVSYLESAQRRANTAKLPIDFTPALTAAHRFAASGDAIHARQ